MPVDARGVCGLAGYAATVFDCNIFDRPPTPDSLSARPKEVFDTGEEPARAGRRVD